MDIIKKIMMTNIILPYKYYNNHDYNHDHINNVNMHGDRQDAISHHLNLANLRQLYVPNTSHNIKHE